MDATVGRVGVKTGEIWRFVSHSGGRMQEGSGYPEVDQSLTGFLDARPVLCSTSGRVWPAEADSAVRLQATWILYRVPE